MSTAPRVNGCAFGRHGDCDGIRWLDYHGRAFTTRIAVGQCGCECHRPPPSGGATGPAEGAAHTPGKWQTCGWAKGADLTISATGDEVSVYGRASRPVAIVIGQDAETNAANARLIASAPALLAAAEAALALLPASTPMAFRLREAIAQARGGA